MSDHTRTLTVPDAKKRRLRPATEKGQSRLVNAVLFVVLAVGSIAMLAPLIWMFTTSLKTKVEVFALPPVLWPTDPQWDTYTRMWDAAPILSGIQNSLIVSLTVTIIGSITSTMAAYALAKMRLPYKNAIFIGLLAGLMIPYPTLMIPQFVMFAKFGWVDTLLPLIVPLLFGNIIMIFFIRQYLASVPDSLIEAAYIDGASHPRVFATIVVPLIRPAIAAQFILWFMAIWNDYLAPILYLNSPQNQTLQVVIANLNVEFATQRDYPLIMGASVVALLPILIVFLIFQRQIIASVALTGTKG
ncbi:multiple sugar transport system permease protein [Microbacterium terrae]|uniref:L-arabinose transport system permease protein AraQ n=1 Tax=Microbacterium terrae TaxID=69369 RepID=A0A0M2H8Y5_9MICO|nr:carbohydrate ABC transporter permease [Microbacterium terrae]KJL42990.1 L-arabinose transport system permease protein AraQ [Microbacterium terrae]MBP1079314.1 multiple sugar transport system permease protein [Microbacterium terrae]GLJ98713.1 sugar ABC transporter permease [Microbacterium terrae]